MNTKLKEFYTKLYGEEPSVFGDGSLALLKRVQETIPFKGAGKRALDIGSGEGLTALWLAEQGYEVDAVDLANTAFSAIPKDDIRIHTTCMDIVDFHLADSYDVICMALTAHHLLPDAFTLLISELKKHTNPAGLHIFRLFTTNSDFYKNATNKRFFDDGENLDTLYHDWKKLSDKISSSTAATSDAHNTLREVVYVK